MNSHKEINTETVKDWQASSLLMLAKEHKKHCDGQCGISLYILFLLYRQLKGEGAIQDMEHFV